MDQQIRTVWNVTNIFHFLKMFFESIFSPDHYDVGFHECGKRIKLGFKLGMVVMDPELPNLSFNYSIQQHFMLI